MLVNMGIPQLCHGGAAGHSQPAGGALGCSAPSQLSPWDGCTHSVPGAARHPHFHRVSDAPVPCLKSCPAPKQTGADPWRRHIPVDVHLTPDTLLCCPELCQHVPAASSWGEMRDRAVRGATSLLQCWDIPGIAWSHCK